MADQEKLFKLLRKCRIKTTYDRYDYEDDDADDAEQNDYIEEGRAPADEASPVNDTDDVESNYEEDDSDDYIISEWDAIDLNFVISFTVMRFNIPESSFPFGKICCMDF